MMCAAHRTQAGAMGETGHGFFHRRDGRAGESGRGERADTAAGHQAVHHVFCIT